MTTATAMQNLIVLFGILIAVAGTALMLRPAYLLGQAAVYGEHPALQAIAVGVRLLLGALLVAYAAQSAFPLTLLVIGWLSIGAAVALLLLGRQRLGRLIRWAVRVAQPWARPAGLVAVGFGAFLVYAVA